MRSGYRHRKSFLSSHRGIFLKSLIVSVSAVLILYFILGGSKSVQLLLWAPRPPALEFPIWWAAPFHSISGYGVEAVSYVTGLLQFGLIRREDLWLTQSGDYESRGANSQEIREQLESIDYRNQVKVLRPHILDRSAIVICHTFPDLWLRPNDTYPEEDKRLHGIPCPTKEMMDKCLYRIGRTMFETDRLPKHLVEHALLFDEIWVPSEFNRQTFAASGVDINNIYLLPQSINLTLYDPSRYEALSVKDVPPIINGGHVSGRNDQSEPQDGSNFIFFSVFKWEGRKGWDILLRAFLEEFKAEEKVELHIATHPYMERVDDWPAKVRQGIAERCNLTHLNFDAMPKILITEDFLQDSMFQRLYKNADALVLPTRGEGWGRPQMEAMAMGLPVISTNWSGVTAFLNEHTGYPIEVEALVEAKKDSPNFSEFFVGTRWAQPSLKHLKQLMRYVFENREEARAKGAAARLYLEENFSPEAVARGLKKLILAAEGRAKDKMMKRLPDTDSKMRSR